MDTLNFLRLVWPTSGLYLLAWPASFTKDGTTHNFYKHQAYTSIEAAADAALAMACDREAPTNVFYALATVQNDYTKLNKQQRDEQQVKVRGRHKSGNDNTHSVKAFWLDLDVGAEQNKYATQAEAALALKAFCKAMGLPRPYVISSGGGMHVYWPLTQEIDGSTWVDHAGILKALTDSFGLRADPSRTADVASILRPVGTYNWKTGNPRSVECVLEGEVVDTQAMLLKLQALQASTQVVVPERRDYTAPIHSLGAIPEHLRGTVSVNEEAAQGAGYQQPKAKDIVQRCQQLTWQMQNPAKVNEPSWYTMIGCLRHATNGIKAVHLMSQGHADYSEYTTNSKIAQHESSGSGPSLCSTFEQHNPGGCEGCPFRGKIKTPLQSIRELTEAEAPTVQVETVEGVQSVTLPPPPRPFKRVVAPGCEAGRVAMRIEDRDGIAFDEVIYENDIYPLRLTWDEREQTLAVAVRSWLPIEGWSEFNIPTGEFYDRRLLSKRMGARGVMVDVGQVDKVVQYMVAYIRELQRHAAANVVYAQLGWRDDKNLFVLPDRVVTPQGVQKIEPSQNIVNSLSWLESRGSLDEWKKIVAVYERKGCEGLQFGFGVGFAAPLFKFTNFSGAIVSVVGKRGTGKSSCALCANSIWGHKKMGWMSLEHDTMRAFYGKIGAMNNLPVTYDEITNLDPEKLSDLTYSVTLGQGRQRLQSNGQAQENYGNWATMMLTTSNASLHSRLAMAKADSSAEASRIFEYHVPAGTIPKAEADALFDKLNDHFGVAAEPYVQALVTQREHVRERIKHWIREVDRLAGTGSSERFWSAVPAAVLAAFEVTNSIGLTKVDIPRILNFAVAQIANMRGEVVETVRTAESMISDYLNSNLRSMLALNSEANGKTLAQITIAPSSDKLRIRLERHNGNLYLDRADFRKFCSSQNIDPKQVESDLKANKCLIRTDAKPVLGKGTIYSTTQTWCWLLDFNNPALAGVAMEIVQSAEVAPQEEAV